MGRLAKINFGGKLLFLSLRSTLLIEKEAVGSIIEIICKFSSTNKVCISLLAYLDISETDISRDGFIELISTINTKSIQLFRVGIDLTINRKSTIALSKNINRRI